MPFPDSPFSPLVVAVSLLFVAAPFFVLGIGIQALCFPRLRLARPHFLAASVASVSLLGYALLWLALASASSARVAAFACWAGALGLLAYGPSRRRLGVLLRDPDVRWPLLLTLAAAFIALELDLAVLADPLPASWGWGSATRERLHLFPDDLLPYALAERLLRGADLSSGVFAQKSLERGPLQAGLVLMQLPVWDLLGSAPSVERRWFLLLYRPYATLLQCAWIAGGFAALRGLGLSVRGAVGVLGGLLPAYFFLMNSVFAWPKLLAGGLVVAAYAVLLQREGPCRRPGALHLAYGAMLAGLGVAAHPGVATSLLAFALLLLAPSRRPRWRDVALASCVFVGIVGPWPILQQRWVDDPGFLVRRHFANVERDDPRGTLEALGDTYRDFTASRFLAHKAEQVSLVLGVSPAAAGITRRNDTLFERLRKYQRNSLVPALGLLNLGWLVVFGARLLRGSPRQRRLEGCRECLGAGLLGTALWLGLQLSDAVLYHGSYASFILLFLGLAAALTCLPRLLGTGLLLAHVGVSLAIALLGWREPLQLAPLHLASAALVAAGLATAFVRAERPPPGLVEHGEPGEA